jgi:vacuolar-type H+-ATPase subunit F/Vma7
LAKITLQIKMSSEKLKELKKRYEEVIIMCEDLSEKNDKEMKKLKEKKSEILIQIKEEEHFITLKRNIGIKIICKFYLKKRF